MSLPSELDVVFERAPLDRALEVLLGSSLVLDDAFALRPDAAGALRRRVEALCDAAFVERDPGARLDLQRALARLLALRTGETVSEHELSSTLHALTITLGRRWQEHVLASIELPGRPHAGADFRAWFVGLVDAHPAVSHGLFPYLAEHATAAELALFVEQERTIDLPFADFLAQTQTGLAPRWKTEIARNYWDEMGRGRPQDDHAELFRRVMAAFALEAPARDALLPGALACGNLCHLLALHRVWRLRSIGCLGILELVVPEHIDKVVLACERLGLDPVVDRYYRMHVVTDVDHAADWVDGLVAPAVDEDPRVALEIARGALLRLEACVDYYDELMALFAARRSSQPAAGARR